MKKYKNHHHESEENQNTEQSEDLENDIENDEEVETLEETAAHDEELEALKEENQKLKTEFLRAYADAENTKKRCQQEIEKNNKYAISSFAKNLLSVADNLHRALDSIPEDKRDECEGLTNLLKGVELTEADLMHIFEKNGIQKMNIMGTVFDPNFHQVVQEVEDTSKPAGTIIAELQTGYMINDRILREAMVIVTKGGPSEK